MTDEVNILGELLTLGPVVSLLVWIIYVLRKELKAEREKNAELNKELRESDREVITVMKDTNTTLEKLIVEIKKD